MLSVPYEKGYKKGTCLNNNLDFRPSMAFRYYCILFSMVILGKSGSAKASLHFFHTLQN